jgi:preprotein translocase subunit SecE
MAEGTKSKGGASKGEKSKGDSAQSKASKGGKAKGGKDKGGKDVVEATAGGSVLQVYAPDRAKYSRWILGATSLALVLHGSYGLFYTFGESMRGAIGGWEPLGDEFSISWAFVITLVIALAGSIGTWWAVNHARFVDFLHDTEVELTKVSWSSKNEVFGSSIVVMVVTVILGAWIFFIDNGFSYVFKFLGY